MSVDVWFTQDIRQIILAAVRANEEALAGGLLVDRDPRHELAYHRGFRAALSTIALALGLPMLPPIDDEEQCTVVESPAAIDTGPGFLASGGDRGPSHELRLPCIGGEVSHGDGSTVV